MRYRRLSFQAPAESEDRLVAELWAAGSLGLEIEPLPGGRLVAHAWFTEAADPRGAAARGRSAGADRVSGDLVPEQDWLAEYRRRTRPFALGERFWVDVGETSGESLRPPAGRRLLRIPARTAFGTGSHESTALMVEMLEAEPPRGCDLLDVGSGSGVLCLVALALGARRAVAVEIDPAAALQGRRICALNGVRPPAAAGTTAALGRAAFDRVLANMTLRSLRRALPDLERLLTATGELWISGVLQDQEPAARRLLADLGFEPTELRRKGEWVALRARLRAR